MKHPRSRHELQVLVAISVIAPAIATAAPPRSPCVPPANSTLIEFRSNENTLRGFIDFPEGSGRHPAIVMVQGAGRSDVTVDTGPFDEMREAFRHAGIATLIWDKAGDGCSEGKYSTGFPVRERATETIAAVQALQRRDDIDPARIGLWGVSQGGWVAPMAAVRSKGVAFLIVVSGPGRDAISQMIFYSTSELRETGIDAAEANAAHAALQRAFTIARRAEGRRNSWQQSSRCKNIRRFASGSCWIRPLVATCRQLYPFPSGRSAPIFCYERSISPRSPCSASATRWSIREKASKSIATRSRAAATRI